MADYIVTGPDGAKYKVTADNDEAANLAVTQMFGGGAPAPAAEGSSGSPGVEPAPGSLPKEPSLVDTIMSAGKSVLGVLDQGVRGGVEGMANVVGLPGDIAKSTGMGTGPVGFVGGIPFLTSDAIKAIPNKLNDWTAGLLGVEAPRQNPDGMAERIARRTGQEVGAMAVPTGAAVRVAEKVGPAAARALIPEATGRKIVDFFRQLPAKMVDSAATAPGKFVGKETTAATAAGLGAAAINENTGKAQADAVGAPTTGWQEAGDLLGALTGVGATATAKKVIDTGKTTAGAMFGSPNMADNVIRDVTVDEIIRAAGLPSGSDTAPLAAKIEGGAKVADAIPGYQESLADRVKSPGLAAMEYGRQGGPNAGTYTARRDANTKAVDDALRTSEPTGATPGALSSELDLERARRLSNADIRTEMAVDEAETLVRPLRPLDTPAERGNTVRGELETARTTARDATAEAYEAAGINDNPLRPTTLAEALDSVTASLPHADRVDTPQGLIDAIANIPPGTELTLREATALKTRLLGLQEKAAAEPGGRNAVRVLGQYVDAVEGVIQQHITPDQQAALGNARTLRRAEGDAFERKGDPVADILSTRPGGQPRMRDENVARLSTRPDALDRILTEADTPATRQAIRNQLLSNADTASAEGVARFVQEYGEQLQRFPGLADELGRAQTARGAQATAQQAQDSLIAQLGSADGTIPGRGTVAKYLQYGDENAQKAMRGVMSSKDPARAADELLSFVNDDPKAVEGARKVFWDIMQKQTRSDGGTTKTISGAQPYLPAALKRFTDDAAVGAVAERLYRDNPEHWANIKKVAEAIQGVDVRNSAKAPNTSGTPQGLAGGYLPTAETIASRIFAVERGVVSPAFAGLNVIGIMARKATKNSQVAAVNMAVDKALLDPEWAAQLLKENNPANRAALARSAKGWMAGQATTLLDLLEPEDQDRDTKRAVMK